MLDNRMLKYSIPVLFTCFFFLLGCGKGSNEGKNEDKAEPLKEVRSVGADPLTPGAATDWDESNPGITGTWKMVYAEIREKDSVQVKDLDSTDFIKIINETHFAFFNQDRGTAENFMAGAGTYSFDGSQYVETLDFISVPEIRGHEFPFEVEIRGDSLIQQGHEKVEAAGIDRYILEKYIRLKK